MSTLGVDGIASGLDTTSIVTALMKIEAAPQTLLSTKKTTAEKVLTSLQSINTKLKTLAEAAATAAKASSWNAFAATSSSEAATATTSSSASAGTLSFSVDAVATTQVSLSAAVASGADLTADNPPTITVKKADGTYASVQASSNSLADIAKAINGGDLGVTATVVSTGSGTSRLQFSGTETGVDNGFEVYLADEATVASGSATRVDATVTRASSDAAITLWAGTGAAQTLTQASNTFTNLMSGVDVTVNAVTEPGEDATITVAADASQASTMVGGLVTQMMSILDAIDTGTASTTTKNADGTTSLAGGVLSGDSLVRNMKYRLSESMTYPINGKSLSEYGIEVDRYGEVTFDEDAFAQALEADPGGVAEAMQALATRIESTTEMYSDPYEGVLTQSITTRQTEVDSLASQIAAWDTRLAERQEALYARFTAMEVSLASLNSQMDYITSALDSLKTD